MPSAFAPLSVAISITSRNETSGVLLSRRAAPRDAHVPGEAHGLEHVRRRDRAGVERQRNRHAGLAHAHQRLARIAGAAEPEFGMRRPRAAASWSWPSIRRRGPLPARNGRAAGSGRASRASRSPRCRPSSAASGAACSAIGSLRSSAPAMSIRKVSRRRSANGRAGSGRDGRVLRTRRREAKYSFLTRSTSAKLTGSFRAASGRRGRRHSGRAASIRGARAVRHRRAPASGCCATSCARW